MFRRIAGLSVGVFLSLGATSNGQTIESNTIFVPNLSAENATYGSRMSARGEWLAVSADYEVSGVRGEGEVYVYKKAGSEWVLHQLLKAPDGSPKNHFGLTTVVGEQRMLVGAPLDDTAGFNAGAVYVYELVDGSWVLDEKLLPSMDNTPAFFGLDCCFGEDETEIISGAYFESMVAINAGAVYIFRHNQNMWSMIQKIVPPNAPASAFFGRSVAYTDAGLLIGSPSYRAIGSEVSTGAVYLYQRDIEEWAWTLVSITLPPDSQSFQIFGEWMDARGNVAVISSPGFDTENGEGIVDLFDVQENGTLEHLQRINPPESNAGAFGFPAIFSQASGDLMIGATRNSLSSFQQGAAYIFQKRFGLWGQSVQLIPSESGEQDFFGLSAAFIDDDREIFVSSPHCDLFAENAGAMFRFKLADCTESGTLDAWEIAAGIENDSNGDQIPDVCQGADCFGDLNGDGLINGSDIGIMLSVFGSTDPPPGADLNGDDYIDGADLGLLFSAWGPCS